MIASKLLNLKPISFTANVNLTHLPTEPFILQIFAGSSSEKLPLITKLIHFLYEEDILLEQPIMTWYKQPPRDDDLDGEDMVDGISKHEEIRKQVRGQNLMTLV